MKFLLFICIFLNTVIAVEPINLEGSKDIQKFLEKDPRFLQRILAFSLAQGVQPKVVRINVTFLEFTPDREIHCQVTQVANASFIVDKKKQSKKFMKEYTAPATCQFVAEVNYKDFLPDDGSP